MSSPVTVRAVSDQLVVAWDAFDAGDHARLAPLLETVQTDLATLVDGRPARGVEQWRLYAQFWLLAAHLEWARKNLATATRLQDAAGQAAARAGDALTISGVALFLADHALIDGRPIDALTQVSSSATVLDDAPDPHDRDAVALVGRRHVITAIILGRQQDRDGALAEIAAADRLARILGEERRVLGVTFGPVTLKADCVFLLLCLRDPSSALQVAKNVASIRLTTVRRAQLLADIGFAHGDLGDMESEQRFIAMACELLPDYTKVALASS